MNFVEFLTENGFDSSKIDEAQKLAKAEALAGITTEDVQTLNKESENFRRALDPIISKSVKTFEENFRSSKLQDILQEEREKVRQELNPELTPEQKEVAELKTKLSDMVRESAMTKLERELQAKAKELGYPLDRAGRFAVYGEQAFEMLENEAEYLTKEISAQVGREIKTRFGGKEPQAPEGKKGELMSRKEFDALDPQGQVDYITKGGRIGE